MANQFLFKGDEAGPAVGNKHDRYVMKTQTSFKSGGKVTTDTLNTIVSHNSNDPDSLAIDKSTEKKAPAPKPTTTATKQTKDKLPVKKLKIKKKKADGSDMVNIDWSIPETAVPVNNWFLCNRDTMQALVLCAAALKKDEDHSLPF